MRRYLTPALLLTLITVTNAQESKTGGPKKTGIEVEVNFINDSTVRMHLQTETLEIATTYGKLSVPIRDIRSIDFGAHVPEGYAEKIDAAIKQLAASDYREREKGVAALFDLGPFSYTAALEASRSKEAEIANRGKSVVQKLQAKYPKKDLKTDAEDRVVTAKFTIMGRIVSPTLKARTDYFGEADLNLANMRTLRTIGAPGPEVELAIDASKYANQGQWLATNFQVDGRSAIVITAKGQVDLLPEQPGSYVVGPSGARITPAGNPFGKVKAGKNVGGQLQGKIGANGDIFLIGERFDGLPTGAGKLYLHITPSQYGTQSSGSYEVRATTKTN